MEIETFLESGILNGQKKYFVAWQRIDGLSVENTFQEVCNRIVSKI